MEKQKEYLLEKINRNSLVMNQVPLEMGKSYLLNLSRAIEISTQSEMLDYLDSSEMMIAKITAILDDDYVKAGFNLEEFKSEKTIK